MKKLIYLSLASLMVAHTATHCMNQLLRADEEAGTDNPPTVVLETDNALANGPELPSREESVQNFLQAAAAASKISRFVLYSSEEYDDLNTAYKAHVAIHKRDKKKAKADLFGLADSFSDDEEYYEKGIEDENKTYQKIIALDAVRSIKHQSNVDANNGVIKDLEEELEATNATLKDLIIKKGTIKQKLETVKSTQDTLKAVDTIFSDHRAQEIALLQARRGELTHKIKVLDDHIARSRGESSALLDNAEVSESITAAFNEQVNIESSLLEEKKKLQEQLDKIGAVIAKLEAPKKGWFGW